MRAERLTDVITHHGEGAGWDPLADDGRGALRCVDMLAGDLVVVDVDGTVLERRHVGAVAAAWRRRSGGGLVVGVERGFALLDHAGAIEWSVEAWTHPGLRMNDGACDPEGRFWCGSMAYDKAPGAGSMWRLDPDRSVHEVRTGVTIPNGLVWSLDGATAFHIDTPTGRIDAWRFVDGELVDRRCFAEVSGGGPDGMTLDAEGGLWVAVWDGSAVHRYDTGGRLSAVVEIGARQVTSCAFGGPGLDRLFVTTSRELLAPDDDPAAGSVFVVEPGVTGEELRSFAG